MKLNILIVTNEAYLFYTKLLLYSLFIQQEDEVDIYLFYRDLPDTGIDDLKSLCEKFPSKHIFPTRLTPEQFLGLKGSEKLSVEAYFRIVALNLLPKEMERILYLDVDMIVKKSLDVLYQTDFGGCAAIACQDIYGYVFGATQQSEKRLMLRKRGNYFNSGMILFNLDWFRTTGCAARILEYVYENEEMLLWEDQDALNVMLEEKVKLVPWHLFNCAPITYICRKADIEAGVVRPMYRDEIAEVDAHPQDFYEMTQAIYEEAHIIHYLGETKPERADRPPASCYAIFDQAYRTMKQRFLDEINRL